METPNPTTHGDRAVAPASMRVVVIDSDLARRAKLRIALGSAGVTTAGEAGHGIEGINLVRDTGPDAVFVALDDRSPRALRTIETLTALPASPPVLAYAGGTGTASMRAAMAAGARDYLALSASPTEIRRSLDHAVAGEQRRRRVDGGTADADGAGHVGTIITVFGAKGGVGKTTIASNLAVQLRQETQQSVALIDLDTRFGDAALALDMPVETSIVELARERRQVTRGQVRSYLTEHASGVMLLPAPPNPTDWSDIGADKVERIIALMASAFDYVVIDTPGTFNDMVATAIEQADQVLVVTTLDVVSVKDTWLAFEMLQSWGMPDERLKLLTNRTTPHSVVNEDDVAAALGRAALTAFPYDRAVGAASAVAQPVVLARPHSPFSKQLTQMARRLAGIEEPRSRGLSSVFSRSRDRKVA